MSSHRTYLYSEPIMRDLEVLQGFSFGIQNISNESYSDDTVLIAVTEEKLQ